MENKKQLEDNEAFYDEKIAPLMAKIIALCAEKNIPHVCCFQLQGKDTPDDDGGPLLCSTLRVHPDNTVGTLMRMYKELKRGPDVFAFTLVSSPNKK